MKMNWLFAKSRRDFQAGTVETIGQPIHAWRLTSIRYCHIF
jgi:hypothetical protein